MHEQYSNTLTAQRVGHAKEGYIGSWNSESPKRGLNTKCSQQNQATITEEPAVEVYLPEQGEAEGQREQIPQHEKITEQDDIIERKLKEILFTYKGTDQLQRPVSFKIRYSHVSKRAVASINMILTYYIENCGFITEIHELAYCPAASVISWCNSKNKGTNATKLRQEQTNNTPPWKRRLKKTEKNHRNNRCINQEPEREDQNYTHS